MGHPETWQWVILNLFQDLLINPYYFLRRLRNEEFIGEILKQVQDDLLLHFGMTRYTVPGCPTFQNDKPRTSFQIIYYKQPYKKGRMQYAPTKNQTDFLLQ